MRILAKLAILALGWGLFELAGEQMKKKWRANTITKLDWSLYWTSLLLLAVLSWRVVSM